MINFITMSELRISSYQTKKRRRQRILRILSIIVRIVLIVLTVNLLSVIFFDDDAIKIKPYLITLLFILLYSQCAILSMRGLDWLVLKKPTRRMLTGSSLLICAPLYFVVLVFSLIPIEEPAVFFITIFPIIALNALPMESIIDEFRLMGYPKPLFWCIQLGMQLAIVGAVQGIVQLLFL